MHNKQQHQSGFAHLVILMAALILIAIASVGFYVWSKHSTKPKQNTQVTTQQQTATGSSTTASTDTQKPTTNQPAAVNQDITGYLTITEWGIKVPLTATTAAATYRMGSNGSVYLQVKVDGDTSGACLEQAGISKITKTTKPLTIGERSQVSSIKMPQR